MKPEKKTPNSFLKLSSNSTREIARIFLGGLPNNSNEQEFTDLLQKKFRIKVIKIDFKRRKNSMKCLGHGLLFLSPEHQKILVETRYIEYGGRNIKMDKCLQGQELKEKKISLSKRRLFVANLPETTESEELEELMQKFGEVESCYMRGEPGKIELVGVVIYSQEIEAQNALKTLSKKMWMFKKLNAKNVQIGFCFKDIKALKLKKLRGEEEEKREYISQRDARVHQIKPSWREYGHCLWEKSQNHRDDNLVFNKVDSQSEFAFETRHGRNFISAFLTQ